MRIVWVGVLSVLLQSCASLTPPSPPTQLSWKQREIVLNRLNQWQLDGKIAVQTPQDAGSATLSWQQQQSQFMIKLYGPLGTNGLALYGHPGQVTLENAKGERVTASSPETLLANQWGWRLPVSHLSYWVRGLPVPGLAKTAQFDEYHRLHSLTQQGFYVQYNSYTTVHGIDLPQRITITAPALRVKLVVHDWKT